MSFLMWPVLATLASAIGSVYLIHYLVQFWNKPGVKWFVLTLVGQATFCFAYAAGMVTTDTTVRWWLEVVAVIGIHWMGIPFLGFALGYTGRGKLLDSWIYRSLYIVPVGVIVLLPTNQWHNLFWTDFRIEEAYGVTVAAYSIQPLLIVSVLLVLTAAGIATLLLFDAVLSYGPLYRKEAIAVALSPVPPTIGIYPWLFSFGPEPHFNAMAVFLLPHVLLDAYAFLGGGMFAFHPATSRAAERTALSDLRQPVMVLNEAGDIAELNAAAEACFETDQADVVTQSVSSVVGTAIDPGATDEQISFQTDDQTVIFRVDSSPLTDSGDNHVGYLLLFQDVTEEVQQKEQLAVLNRVLRHNLRNELTVAQGHLGVAANSTDDQTATASLEKSQEALTTLLATSEKAREIERALNSASGNRKPVSLCPLIADVTETVADSATVTVECPPISLRTDPELLATVFEQALDNAVSHHTKTPTIDIRVENRPDRLQIIVADDGPGIPDHELEVLESGEERALEHGSGLGLWLIKWGTTRLGGNSTFETIGDGTRVVLSFPQTMVETTADQSAPASNPPAVD